MNFSLCKILIQAHIGWWELPWDQICNMSTGHCPVLLSAKLLFAETRSSHEPQSWSSPELQKAKFVRSLRPLCATNRPRDPHLHRPMTADPNDKRSRVILVRRKFWFLHAFLSFDIKSIQWPSKKFVVCWIVITGLYTIFRPQLERRFAKRERERSIWDMTCFTWRNGDVSIKIVPASFHFITRNLSENTMKNRKNPNPNSLEIFIIFSSMNLKRIFIDIWMEGKRKLVKIVRPTWIYGICLRVTCGVNWRSAIRASRILIFVLFLHSEHKAKLMISDEIDVLWL